MEYELELYAGSDFPSSFRSEWEELFASCYGRGLREASHVFAKYTLNKSRFCAMYCAGKLVGCYSGLELDWGSRRVFLSTDTMSDGTIRSASQKMGSHLYEHLTEAGVAAVVGYPNDNIRRIREKKLGWQMDGLLHLWVGIPIVASLCKFKAIRGVSLWRVARPDSGFFGAGFKPLRLDITDEYFGLRFGIPIALATQSPGGAYVKVPSSLVKPKTFGYRVLNEDGSTKADLLKAIESLDAATIDLP